MATIRWTDKAVSDIEDIYDYIATDSPFYAKHQVEKFLTAVKKLLDFPSSGRQIPEFPDLPHREILISPYRIIYRYEPNLR